MAETTKASKRSGRATRSSVSAKPLSRSKSSSSARGDSEIDTRTRLLEAAGPVFAAHGFDGATVREICSAAHVNVASVGYYFGDKLGLYREVIRGDSRQPGAPLPDA